MHLKVENLRAGYAQEDILKSVNLDIPRNSFVGIIGPNGCGKSTLLKCMYRVLKPRSGLITLGGTALDQLTLKESAKQMAVVSQHHHQDFDFSVLEVLLMGRAPHKKALERDNAKDYEVVHLALEQVGMLHYKNKRFNNLSGGEKQRIILARALAQEPACLMLDEPTNHMDIKHQLGLLSLVKQMNLTVVAALHDLNIAAMFCDYLYVLKEGQVIAKGSPKEVLTVALIEEVYEVKAQIIKGEGPDAMHIIYQMP